VSRLDGWLALCKNPYEEAFYVPSLVVHRGIRGIAYGFARSLFAGHGPRNRRLVVRESRFQWKRDVHRRDIRRVHGPVHAGKRECPMRCGARSHVQRHVQRERQRVVRRDELRGELHGRLLRKL
jgi:hypothetical protein